MMEVLVYPGMAEKEWGAAYEAYLMRTRPPKGSAVISSGAYVFISPEREPFAVMKGDHPLKWDFDAGIEVWAEEGVEERAAAAVTAFCSWRRLPVQTALAATDKGFRVFPASCMPFGKRDCQSFSSEIFLEKALTEKETAKVYGLPEKQVLADCEAGAFGQGGACRSAAVWLIRKSAADSRYGKGEEKIECINPLVLVFSSAEAAHLWNRPAEDVRSAAAGAGHRARRLGEADCRRAGRTWLVTRDAMERLYGSPSAGAMKDFLKNLR